MYCCERCFNNNYIKEYIITFDEIGVCDYCSSRNSNLIHIEYMGEYIRDCLHKAYENATTGDLPYRVIKNFSESIEEVLLTKEEVFSDRITCENNLFQTLFTDLFKYSGPSDGEIMEGEIDEWEWGDAEVLLKGEFHSYDTNFFYMTWEEFKEKVKHENRFFDMDHASSRESMLKVFDFFFDKMEEKVPVETEIFRARVLSKDINNLNEENMILECGPPPSENTTSLRMSPAGISYFYGADDLLTCKKEVRYTSEQKMVLGTFKTKIPLRVINLSKLHPVHADSIFSDDYNHELNWAYDFLEMFIKEISKPINDHKTEIEYIPTQIISEYIRLKGYDGVTYDSSLAIGKNYTLFCGRKRDLVYDHFRNSTSEIPDFKKWLDLVNYTFFSEQKI